MSSASLWRKTDSELSPSPSWRRRRADSEPSSPIPRRHGVDERSPSPGPIRPPITSPKALISVPLGLRNRVSIGSRSPDRSPDRRIPSRPRQGEFSPTLVTSARTAPRWSGSDDNDDEDPSTSASQEEQQLASLRWLREQQSLGEAEERRWLSV